MWLTALIIGFAGSLHCLAMCSPLAMAVTSLRKPFFVNRLVYNGGRIICYGFLGAFVSTFGGLFQLSGFQTSLTLILGSALILVGLAGTRYIRIPILTQVVGKVSGFIKMHFAGFLQRKSTLSVAMLGFLNGLLPCGLTYIALTYCLTLPQVLDGFAFMLIFGMGTLPVMLGLTSGIHALINRIHLSSRNFTTAAMIALGILLVTRGAFEHHREQQERDAIVICK